MIEMERAICRVLGWPIESSYAIKLIPHEGGWLFVHGTDKQFFHGLHHSYEYLYIPALDGVTETYAALKIIAKEIGAIK